MTDENAAAGSRSLKFTDAPGQEQPFNPHAFHQPNYSQGTVIGCFDLWMGPGASFYHEWRKNAQPRYIVGPSITIDPQGKLRTGNRDLAAIPREQWVTIEIRCALGSGTWSLSLTAPRAAEPVVFDELPCDAAFDAPNWYGFCSMANEDTVFYLDNVEAGPSGEQLP